MLDVPFDNRDGWIWMDGTMVPWREAKIHFLSHGLHYASAVFEGARAYGGKIFLGKEHTARLFFSANELHMKIPFSQDEINQACKDVVAKNNLVDAYVRPLVWRGPEQMGIAGLKTKTHVAIAAWSWPSYFSPEQRNRGLKLMISKWRRTSPDTAPVHAKASGLYVICTLTKHEADAGGYDDALMLDYRGQVAEGTGSNVFFIKDGEIHTPLADCFLNGLTRQTAIMLAKRRGIVVHERAIMPDELGTFEQAFLTGTAVEIAPIGQIAEHKYQIGELVKQLVQDYQDEVRR
jgi:branched-chain amino acid aminotransferase